MSNMTRPISQNWSLITGLSFAIAGFLLCFLPYYCLNQGENSSFLISFTQPIITLIFVIASIFFIVIKVDTSEYEVSRGRINQNIDYGAVSENCHWHILNSDSIAFTNLMSNKEKQIVKKEVMSELGVVDHYTRLLSLEPKPVKHEIRKRLSELSNYKDQWEEIDEVNTILYDQLASNLLDKVDPVYLYLYANDIDQSADAPIFNTPNIKMTFWFYAILTAIFIFTSFFFGWWCGLSITLYSFVWYSMVSAAINSNIKNNVNVIIQQIYEHLEGFDRWNGVGSKWTKLILLKPYQKQVSRFQTWGIIVNTLKLDRRISIYTKGKRSVLLYYGNNLYLRKQAAKSGEIVTEVFKKHVGDMLTYACGVPHDMVTALVPKILSKNNVRKQFASVLLKSWKSS